MSKENKNKKILVMTVGTGAKGADIAHGLFFSIKDSNPDILILIGSSRSFDITLSHLKNLIEQENLNLEINETVIEEVNDFENLHFEYSQIIQNLLRNGYSINKICIDYTSGTKAMSAALVSAAIENKIGTISYVYGKRDDGGRVMSGTEIRNVFSPNKIYSKNRFQKAIELFNNFRYISTIELLTNHEFHPDYQERVDLLLQLANMFDAWDKFFFTKAFEISCSISLEKLKEFSLKGKFESCYQPILFKLKENKLSFEKVFDLIENANRRAKEGKYDDAVARLYRALEMICQIEFEKEFNCSTSDVNIQMLPENLRSRVINDHKDEKDGKIKIPLFGVYEILYEIKNDFGVFFNKELERIKKIISMRNNSILAHGSIPLSQKDFNLAFDLINSLLTPINKHNYNFSFPIIK